MTERYKLGPENFLTAFCIAPVLDWKVIDDRIRYEFRLETEGKTYYIPWANLSPWNVPSFREELDRIQRVFYKLGRGWGVYCPQCDSYNYFVTQNLHLVGPWYERHMSCRSLSITGA